jgi:flagellin FlaB
MVQSGAGAANGPRPGPSIGKETVNSKAAFVRMRREGVQTMKTLTKLLAHVVKREEGITGLETAIILIAFVIVASVFAFVVLSTGLFSAERGKETVFAGLDKARGNLEVRGSLTVVDTDTDGDVDSSDEVIFNLANAAGGFPVNVDPTAYTNTVVINYIDAQDRVADATFTTSEILGDGDTLVENGELFEVTLNLPGSSTLVANEIFTVEVVPPSGGVLIIMRTMPPAIDDVMDLK